MQFTAVRRVVTVLVFAFTVLAPANLFSAESGDSLKGIVERVEGGKFLVDSAWVQPERGARFKGSARNVGRIRVGDWADVDGRWMGAVFMADRIKVSRDFPGHTFQGDLSRQGLAEAEKIKGSKNAYKDAEVEAYVQRIGLSVVPGWARKQFNFQFQVISDPSLNAFALPDGSIFVHTGLLARVENESQLAGILGHEVSHVTEHHSAQGYKKQMTTFLPAIIGAQVVGMKISDKSDNPFVQLAAQAGLTLAVSAAVSGYGRTHEDQADRVGLRYAVEAGYDPAPAPGVWDVFNRTYGDQSKIENFFYGSHSTNRIRKANQEREIRRHYADPSRLQVTHAADDEGYQRAMLPLTLDNAVLDFEAKRYGLARSGFQRVLRHRKNDAPSHTYLGRIDLASDIVTREADADARFRLAIQSDPAYPEAHRELGRLLAFRKKNAEAKRELKKYLDLAPVGAKDRKDVEKELGKIP